MKINFYLSNALYAIAIFVIQYLSKSVILAQIGMVNLYVTNLKCISLDESFVNITKCETVPYNNTYKLFSMRGVLLQTPVERVSCQITLSDKATNRQIIKNFVDICEFFEKRNNRFFNIFFDILKHYTNVIHSCPYTEDIIVDKFPTTLVSMPIFTIGDHRIKVLVYAYDKPRGQIQFDVTNKPAKKS